MKLKLVYRKAAVLAYCAAFNLSADRTFKKGTDHKRAMKHGVEVLRLSSEGEFNEKEAGVQLLRDLMQSGLLRVEIDVRDNTKEAKG